MLLLRPRENGRMRGGKITRFFAKRRPKKRGVSALYVICNPG
jgi:hypothetical protein